MIGAVLFAGVLSANTARAIAIAPRERPSWALLELPQQIESGPDGNYDDLRVIDDRGNETPYVVDPQCAAIPARQAILSDAGFVPGRYTEALVDAGNSGTLYSGVSIDTPRNTYFDRVDVAISDDRSTWREVRNEALIYRVADSSDPGSQTVLFLPSRARWIRIRIIDGNALFPIDTATLVSTESTVPEAMKRLDASATSAWRDEDRTSVVTLDLGTPNTRIARIRFRTTQAEFSRDVSIQTSNDGEHWDFAGGGPIKRFADGAPVLDVSIPEAGARYVRAEVANGNDAPLPNLSVSIFGPRRVIVFVARSGSSYALTRSTHAQAPTYDLGTLLEHDNPRAFATARLAGITSERSPGLRAGIPQPLIWTLAFAMAIVTLGAVTVGALRPRS
ncbi:MAG TPA: DUF3999 family protein [Candidatus Tumulicola sp.]